MSSLSELSSDDELPPVLRRNRTFCNRLDPFEQYSDIDFKKRFRLDKESVTALTALIGENISPLTSRNKSIDARLQILVTLRFLATGTFQNVIGDSVQIHKSTVCRIVKRVCHHIALLKPNYINMPRTQQERQRSQFEFYMMHGFPGVIGCVDCTHIKVSPPAYNAEIYRCRKGYFSINVQAVCDAQLKFTNVIARWPGSTHDSTIFNNSPLNADFEMGAFGNSYLLGDNGYACKLHLLTPFLNPNTPSQEAYNHSHKSTRNSIERSFGILKKRFPCLHFGLRNKMETSLCIIVACFVLHNMCIDLGDHFEDDVLFDEDDGGVHGPANLNTGMQQNTAARTALVQTHFAA